jgi:thioesterase domain-containing protein/non-ribosomal peptide synthetase component F/acyl carrier protein
MTILNPLRGGRDIPGAPAKPENDILAFPLSPAQTRMWLADQEWPGNPAYNASFRWSLEGDLNPSILQQAFNEIVARHEILRATFGRSDGVVLQLVTPSLKLLMPVTDLRTLSAPERGTKVERICAAEAARAFNLEKGPLIRVGLLRVENDRHILLLTLHHIICDGWSIGVILRELQQLYVVIVDGRGAQLPPLALQFPDYVIWKTSRAQEGFDKALAYWKDRLRGYRGFKVDPDFPNAPERAVKGAIVSRLLPRDVTDALKTFSNQQSGTMFSTTLAACFGLLHRHTGKSELAIGTPLAGRDRTEIENLIGLFVNHVLFRIDAAGDPVFADLAAGVRDDIWEVLANQETPFENIIASLPAGDKPEGEPFCSVNFVCQRAFGGSVNSEFDFPGIHVSPIPSASPGALYDLNFFMVERDDGWRLSLEYKTDMYSSATAGLLIDNFCRLLEEIASNPNRRLSEFILLPNSKTDEYPTSCPAASSVGAESDADVNPDAIETFQLPASVGQLRFWQLAQIRPDGSAFNMPATVRISGPLSAEILERSMQTIIDRHEILRTTFKEVDGELRQLVAGQAKFKLRISDVRDVAAEAREGELSKLLREEARVLFDLESGPVLRARLFRLTDDDHVLIVTLHHIISDGWSQGILQSELWTVYEALLQGRGPGLPPLPVQYPDFAVWQKEWLASDEATRQLGYWMKLLAGPLPVLDFPTDHAPGQRPGVHGAIETIGLPEELTRRLKLLSQSTNVTMFMLMAAAFAILLERYTDQHDLTIGSPSANRTSQTEQIIGPFSGPIALRLNLAGEPTLREILARVGEVTMDALDHSGLPFEIVLDQLKMRSVHGRNPLFQFYFLYQTAFLQPRETKDLVITPMAAISVGNPFEIQLAIIERPDGVRANLEYDQGLFEPASVRNILNYYRFLLEEIAANPDQSIADLRRPSATRRQAPTAAVVTVAQDAVAPRNVVEIKLVEMWKRLFEVSRIGVRDDFFDLGGHSLLAARLISMIEKEFGVRLDLSKLLVARTIEQIARIVTVADESHRSSLIPLRASGSKTPLFCVHGGGGHVLGYQDLAEALPEDQPVYGLSAPELDGAQRSVTVQELATVYNREIRRVQPHGPYRLCGYSFGGFVAFEMAAQLIGEGEEVPVLVMLDTGNSGYYRHLPSADWFQFWTTRIVDRIKRYYRRLADRRLDVAISSAFFFVRKNVHLRVWTMAQRIFRMANRPMPAQMRDNVTMFKTVAWSYEPTPIRARIILFRVEGRDPEYFHNKSLGWELAAAHGVAVHYVPGDHLSFMRQPHVLEVAAQLKPYLV